MVHGRGFNSRVHLKTRYGKDGPLDCRKNNKNNKDSQMGQVTPNKVFLIMNKFQHMKYVL